jgi:hypothetical protein
MKKYITKSQEEWNILQTIKRRNTNWIGNNLRRNCLLIHVIEGTIAGRIEVTGRLGKRRAKLLDGLKEKREYWWKEEAVDRTLWRVHLEEATDLW